MKITVLIQIYLRKCLSLMCASILIAGFSILSGCSTESRYRNTDDLERPPLVVSHANNESHVADTSWIPKKRSRAGLGNDVYQNSATQLTIKQPLDEAWHTVARALKQEGIKITDQERDKGQYYVTRDNRDDNQAGFFTTLGRIFSDDVTVYLLTLTSVGMETSVTINPANAAEQNDIDGKNTPVDGATDLLQLLFHSLRDKLEDE